MTSRPAIPADIQREVFTEAGHRCAVCGTPFPLERAHIVPWSRSSDHSAANLICLCANCHERADHDWDEKTLRIYKVTPWIIRQHPATIHRDYVAKSVTITIDLDLENFDEKTGRWLVHALAGFLEIPPQKIAITAIEPGSVKVTITLPPESAELLISHFSTDPKGINAYSDPIRIVNVTDSPAPAQQSLKTNIYELLKGFLGVSDEVAAKIAQCAEPHIELTDVATFILNELALANYSLSEDLKLAIRECLSRELISCPRCLGSGYVTWADISRLGMEDLWSPGYCLYCFKRGTVPSYLPFVHGVTSPPPHVSAGKVVG